ncbi:MAG: PEP-CTERM sorting domain-containing protein [Verrucomicrobiota bacterium]
MRTTSSPLRALRPFLALAALAPVAASAQVIFIDFGGGGSSETSEPGKSWNNVTGVGTSDSAIALLDYNTNLASGLSYEITDAFLASNGQGDQLTVGEFPVNATRDSFYGDNSNPLGQIEFTGFDPGKQYTFTFLSSRDSVSGNRSTLFTVTGAGTSSVAINSALATPETGTIFSITPSVSGSFVLDVTKDAANDNSSGFYYLNALKIEAVSSTIPEPSAAAALLGLGALGLCVLRRKR